MKTILITLLFIMNSFISTAQQTPKEQFKDDLENNKITLYVLGGIVSRATPADEGFQKKYNIRYYDFGCLAPPNLDYYTGYNAAVLNYLEKNFVSDWKKDIRKDIMGWHKWNKK